jgi:pilus assembly protein CpaB
MSKLRIVLFVLAGIAAVVAGLMARNFAGSRPEKEVVVQDVVKKTEVLVAAKDLRLGEKMSDGAIAWKSWPLESVQEGMITKEAQPDAMERLAEGRARAPIYVGETIIDKKIVMSGDKGFMAAILPKGMRAISVAISERSSAGGFILPNDRVDVILTRKMSVEGGNQLVVSETVLSNVRVLAVNQNYGKQEEGADTIAVPEGKTATLELTARQAEVVAQVESTGELSLALRSIAENDGVPLEQTKPVLAEKYTGTGKTNQTDTLFVRYGRETYSTNR